MVVFPAGHKGLDEQSCEDQDPKHWEDGPRVPARLDVRSMLSKQEQVIDHGAKLQVVVQAPHGEESPKDRRAEDEQPFLEDEGQYPHSHTHHHCYDDWHVEVLTEEGDVY